MKRLAIMALALGGCATASVEPYTAPDGRSGFVATCSSEASTIADCHAIARESCGGNYEVINTSVTPRYGQMENRAVEVVCTP